MNEQRWIQAIVATYGVTLSVYVVLKNWQVMLLFSGSCTGEENYGIPPVVYEASIIAGLLFILLVVSNLSLILLIVKQRMRSLVLLISALIINFFVSLELEFSDVSSTIFDFVEILRGSINPERFWWNLPNTMTTLAGIASVSGIVLLMIFWTQVSRQSFKADNFVSISEE